MSDTEGAAGPRRSQRERKLASHFVSVDSQLSKRKRSDDEEESDLTDIEDQEPADVEADVEEDYSTPRVKSKARQSEKGPQPNSAAPKRKGRPPGKKPRTTKGANAAAPLKPRKPRARKGAGSFDAEQVAKETKITNDNPLFNAIMNPSAALQSVVEDFLDSLAQTPEVAQAELINAIFRACGCNHTLDGDEAVDYDGIVDALDNITEALKQDDSPVYPLTSKLPAFKPFRASLSEFLSRLISSAAAMGQLYNTDLMTTLQSWVVAMSSSQLRSFRHTASVVALEVETALCDVAAAVEKEAEVVSRQKEGERKRKKGKGEPATAREKELDGKASEIRERRAKLAEFLKEFVDGVFVHRYRDLDPNIRAECVRAMGLWFSQYPAHFLDGTYLRYVGWVLSDSNTNVRLEAVRALSLAYAQTEFIGIGALQHFTERFKPRMVEMAVGDTELSVRVAVVQVLKAIDEHALLEEEQREELCLLIFDEEPKMRRAVSGFVKGVWEEDVNERLVGKKPDAKEKKRAGIKTLAMLLVQCGKALDQGKGTQDEDEVVDEEGEQSEGSKRGRRKEVVSIIGPDHKSRTALAVEALWDDIAQVSDWESLLELLQLDHSAAEEDHGSQSQSKKKGKHTRDGYVIDEVWRLEDVEEGVLLEVLLASLRKAKAVALAGKKGEEETVSSDITRALIKALPRLFVKYQTDPGRMSDVLQIPQLMNLDMYLDMRMMTAYSSLWDDIIKQFMSHSAPIVLSNAVTSIRYMMDATSLSNTNSMKILELEEQLSSSLRDLIKGRDELEIASFDEDEVLALTGVCTRLATLAGTRDMTSWMEEDEGGKQSSAWDIIMALVERGKLGYREEDTLMEQALHLQTLYVMWKTRGLTSVPDPSPEELRYRGKLKESRDTLVEKLQEYAVGTQSNTSEAVKRAAFQSLMNIHILFCPAQSVAPDGTDLPTAALALTLADEVQYRLAGLVQAEIEMYVEELDEAKETEEENPDTEPEHSEDEEQPKPRRSDKAKGKQREQHSLNRRTNRSQLEREYLFMSVIATFLRAIRAGAIHFRHCATLLAYYGRLGPSFDLCSKLIVDILREEGMYKDNGEIVATIITQAVRDSFLMFVDGVSSTEDNAVALAKLLSSAFLIRGAQLAVVRRLDSNFIVQIHTGLITWLCKRIATSEAGGNKKARNKNILFFRVLLPLLNSVDTRDSLRIKAHLDQTLAQAKVEVPTTSKTWDAYRAYEKRLQSSKEKGVGGRAKKGKAKALGDVTTDDEEIAVERINGTSAPAKPKPKPKSRPRTVRREAESTDDENASEHEIALPQTPRPRGSSKQRSPVHATPSRSPSPTESRSSAKESSPPLSEPPTTPEPEETRTPTVSRKRPRSPEVSDQGSVLAEDDAVVEEPPSGGASPGEVNEFQFRRKRVRH